MSTAGVDTQSPISIHHTHEIAPPPRTRYLRLDFQGSSGEYFRIWIVNVFLTIITLGIYGAWAKVRTRKYFYANTMLDGHPFEYHGDPIAILKGNLVIGAFALAFAVVRTLGGGGDVVTSALFGYLLVGAFYLVYPFLVHSSLRFMASNTSYRNIRFRFHGTVGGSYFVHLGLPILMVFSFGLLWPFVQYKQKQFMLENAAYGTARTHFKGEVGPYYMTYLVAGLWAVLGMAIVGASAGMIAADFSRGGVSNDPLRLLLAIAPVYAGIFVGGALIQAYITARLTNYAWQHLSIPGKLRFESTVKARDLMWLRFTNLCAIGLSLGLLSPWAKVRHVQYMLSHFRVFTNGELDTFQADRRESESALGDAATDFLNVEFSL